jgi:hypothetical protein
MQRSDFERPSVSSSNLEISSVFTEPESKTVAES